MNSTRQRRIDRGSIIPDGQASPLVERLSRAYWDGERASDGFSSGWEYITAGKREVIRAGVVSLLAAYDEERQQESQP